MFESFKKRKMLRVNDTTIEELRQEYDKEKRNYLAVASTEMFTFLVSYFEAKIELNRDKLELLDPFKESDRPTIANIRAENNVMRDFITEINEMAELYKVEAELEETNKSQKLEANKSS
jgi:PIN domain nuclease of toxin-antitoxin system